MKENRLSKMLAVGAISALALTTAVAQETTTVTKIHRPGDWNDDDGIGYDDERRNNRGRASLGLHQFPHLHDGGAGEILLHQEHHHRRPDGQNGGMVGSSSGHAGNRLLREGRRPHDRSQGRADEAGQRGD